MATVIDSLLIRLRFDADTSGAASFDSGLGKIIKTAGQVGAAITGVGIAAAGFVFKGVLDAGIEFENFKTQLTTIEGSSEKAQKSLDWIADFAKKTPYELAGVTDAFVKLKSYGIDPIKGGFMESIGNMASAMGKDLNQAVEAVADAMTGENERLKEFGIKASKDAASNEITYTYNNSDGETFTKTVKNDAKEIQAALQGIMDQKFDGGMEAMSKTWEGTVNNLKDVYGGFLRSIADAGVFDMLKDALGGLAEWVSKNEDKIASFALALANGFGTAITTIGAVIDLLVAAYDEVASFISWLDSNSQTIITTLKTIGVIAAVIGGALLIMYAPAIAGFLLMQATGLLSFAMIAAAAIASAVATGAAWLIAFAPFLLIGAVIAIVIGLLWLIYENWDQIVAGLVAEWERIKAAFSAGVAAIGAWWSGLMASISAWWSGLIASLSAGIASFIAYISAAFPTITAIISAVVSFISSIWNAYWSTASAIVSAAISVISSIINTVVAVFSSVVATISGLWSGLWAGIKSAAAAAIDFVIGKVQALIGMVSGVLGTIAKIGNFKMPSFSGAGAAMGGGKNGGGGGSNTSNVNQTFNVASPKDASNIAGNSVEAQRKKNNGYK